MGADCRIKRVRWKVGREQRQRGAYMEAKERKINEILTENRLYEIPAYQRPYSWDEEHSLELIQDIYNAFKRNDTEYFIGSIITIEKEKNRTYDVVDGQQRLTTLNLIFAVLKQMISNKSSVEDIQKRLMPLNPHTDEPEKPRLTVRMQDQNFFLNHIILGEKVKEYQEISETQERLRTNSNEIKNFLKSIEESENGLRRLVNYILEHVYVVFVITDSLTSAYRLFNVLNARGLSLSNGDLLKNKLFEYAEKKEQERKQIENSWNELEQIVGIKNLDIFLGHLRTAIKGNKAKETLYKEFYEIIDENYKEFPSKFAKLLVDSANNYVKIIEKDFEDCKTDIYLQSLENVSHDEWIPPILAFLNKPVKNMELYDFIGLIDRITYQNWIRRLGKTKRNTVYYRLINQINNSETTDIIRHTVVEFANNEEFKSHLESDFYNNTYCKAVLFRIERELQDDSVSKDFNGRITIEHVLPQYLQDEYWTIRFTKEKHRELLNRIGNLTLLSASKNSSAKAFSFDKKKEIYIQLNKKVSFDLTKEICEEIEWTEEIIRQRQKRLIECIMNIWEIN